MGHLVRGVHARVRAPGALDPHRLAANRAMAVSMHCCTEGAFPWNCQPQKGAPSYSITSL